MGTPEFAVPSMEILAGDGHDILAVVTQPDKPKGRGNKMTPPPVKEAAIKMGIPVLQPDKIKTQEFKEQVEALKPDLIVTCAYGKILPDYILNIPPKGCINVHGSLLPRYRGAAPIQWAIIKGEKTTGVTTMFMDVGLDTGDMLLKEEMDIGECDTAGELHDKLSILGSRVLKETLRRLMEGSLKRIPQPHGEATYASILKKDTGLIQWALSAEEIHDLVRGTNPWPGAYTYLKGERLRIWKTSVSEGDVSGKHPGTVVEASGEGLVITTGEGLLRILELQTDDRKKMDVRAYIAGHPLQIGEMLGS